VGCAKKKDAFDALEEVGGFWGDCELGVDKSLSNAVRKAMMSILSSATCFNTIPPRLCARNIIVLPTVCVASSAGDDS
jgi:hypothetical protein